MIESVLALLYQWNKSNDDRTKLQHSYLAGAIGALVIGGVIGLFDYRLGQNLLTVALGLALLFVINLVAWALLQAFVLTKLAKPKRTTTKK